MKRQQDIQRILEDFKGVKNIPGIKSAKKRVLITKIKNEKREIITSRKGIANVFGDFHKKYATTMDKKNLNKKSERVKMRTASMCITTTPKQKSCKLQSTNSKKGNSPDGNGIRAEDIKACDDETSEMVRQIFNEFVKQNEFTPEERKKVKLKVIYKKCGKC